MIKITALIWDEWNISHISRHNVNQNEVEELCSGSYKSQPSYNERILIMGRLSSGRALTVVLSREKPGQYYPVTARDMSKIERRKFL